MSVIITKGGLYFIDTTKRKARRKRVPRATVWARLRDACDIEEGVTLGDIFRMVDSYPRLKAFFAQYSWCRSIDEHHAQANEPHAESDEPLSWLEIYWWPEVNEYSETKKHPGGTRERTITVDFDVSAGFHGVGPNTTGHPANRDDGLENISVSYCPAWELVDVPVRLDKDFTVYRPFRPENAGKPREVLLKSSRDFSLLEVLGAIYYDISFVGGPAEKREFMEDLLERRDEAMEMIDHEELKRSFDEDEGAPPCQS